MPYNLTHAVSACSELNNSPSDRREDVSTRPMKAQSQVGRSCGILHQSLLISGIPVPQGLARRESPSGKRMVSYMQGLVMCEPGLKAREPVKPGPKSLTRAKPSSGLKAGLGVGPSLSPTRKPRLGCADPVAAPWVQNMVRTI